MFICVHAYLHLKIIWQLCSGREVSLRRDGDEIEPL